MNQEGIARTKILTGFDSDIPYVAISTLSKSSLFFEKQGELTMGVHDVQRALDLDCGVSLASLTGCSEL